MARERIVKRREGVFALSVPLAFLAPTIAPYLWLVLFFDPATRLASRAVSRGGR